MHHPATQPVIRALPIILLFLVAPLYPFIHGAGQPEEAEQAIEKAQSAINTAFAHLLQADLAGAPITDLVEELNGAIADLSSARAAFNASNYQKAIIHAQKAQNTAEAVGKEAQERTLAVQLSLTSQIIFSIVAAAVTVAIIYLLLTRWRNYQKHQTRALLGMEIRLSEQQEEEEENESHQ